MVRFFECQTQGRRPIPLKVKIYEEDYRVHNNSVMRVRSNDERIRERISDKYRFISCLRLQFTTIQWTSWSYVVQFDIFIKQYFTSV